MRLIRGLKQWTDTAATVATIGNFDGVHLGHQAMFATTQSLATTHKLSATVISFAPLPHEYFSPDKSPARLQGLRDRVRSIEQTGMDNLLLMHFNEKLANMSAEQFINEVVIDTLNIKHLVVGDDFRFGHKRSGTVDTLMKAGASAGFTVQQSPTCKYQDQRVSSTRVRAHLSAGELDEAGALLGRPYRISGRVIHGEKVGRTMGFPTANVALGAHNPPLRGVFAVWATHLASGERFAAVANLGERPTVGGRKLLLEVHALDQNVDWYGTHLAIDFIALLRGEKRFNSLDELKNQIALDAEATRQLMSNI